MDTLDLLLNPATVANEGFKFRLGSPNPKSVMSSWWWRLHPGCGLDPIGNRFEAFFWEPNLRICFFFVKKNWQNYSSRWRFCSCLGLVGWVIFLGIGWQAKEFDVGFFLGGGVAKIWGSYFHIWVFPKIGVPPNHPIFNRVFPWFSPSILGPIPIFGNAHLLQLFCHIRCSSSARPPKSQWWWTFIMQKSSGKKGGGSQQRLRIVGTMCLTCIYIYILNY